MVILPCGHIITMTDHESSQEHLSPDEQYAIATNNILLGIETLNTKDHSIKQDDQRKLNIVKSFFEEIQASLKVNSTNSRDIISEKIEILDTHHNTFHKMKEGINDEKTFFEIYNAFENIRQIHSQSNKNKELE